MLLKERPYHLCVDVFVDLDSGLEVPISVVHFDRYCTVLLLVFVLLLDGVKMLHGVVQTLQ